MKKLVFMFVAMAAMSFASCGNNQPNKDNIIHLITIFLYVRQSQ